MNAKQAIKEWNTRDSLDAFQPWEIAEMLDALVMRIEELEAAQQSAGADDHDEDCQCEKCYNKGVLLDEYLAHR